MCEEYHRDQQMRVSSQNSSQLVYVVVNQVLQEHLHVHSFSWETMATFLLKGKIYGFNRNLLAQEA
jgi:hypothetical protein